MMASVGIPVLNSGRNRIVHPVIKRIGKIIIHFIEGYNTYFFKAQRHCIVAHTALYRNGDHFFLQVQGLGRRFKTCSANNTMTADQTAVKIF